MRDHYRSKQIALWLNLIPDLETAAAHSAKISPDDDENREGNSNGEDKMLTRYKSYDELLPFVPKLKVISFQSDTLSTPSSSEVVWPNATNSDGKLSKLGNNEFDIVNATHIFPGFNSFANYSTALSVTIAIGCSLLVLNLLIFAAVYYQREHRGSEHRKKIDPVVSSSKRRHTDSPNITQVLEINRSSSSISQPKQSRSKTPPDLSDDDMSKTLTHHHLPPPEFADYGAASTSLMSPPEMKANSSMKYDHYNQGVFTLPQKSSLKKSTAKTMDNSHWQHDTRSRRYSVEELNV